MKKYTPLYSLLILASASLWIHCSSNNKALPIPLQISGWIISNEGNFSDANGSLSLFDPEERMAYNNLLQSTKQQTLGGIIQKIRLIDRKLFVITNNANMLYIFNYPSFEQIAKVDLEAKNPVDIGLLPNTNKAYITDLFQNVVWHVDLTSYQIVDSIHVGSNPRDILVHNNFAYVANTGFGNDSTITVIHTDSHTIEQTLTVGRSPNQLYLYNNQLWVVCQGLIYYDEQFIRQPQKDIPGSIHIIDLSSLQTIHIIETDGFPIQLEILELDNNVIGWLVHNTKTVLINPLTFTLESMTTLNRSFSFLSYSPTENIIYAGKNTGYTQSGQLLRLQPLNLAVVDSFTVGIAPNGIIIESFSIKATQE